MSGTVDLLVVQGAVALPQIRAGKIKALANCRRRVRPVRTFRPRMRPVCPDFTCRAGSASGREGTPKDIIAKLNGDRQALADPAIRSASRNWLDVAPRTANAEDWPRSEGRDRQMVADHQVGRHRRARSEGTNEGRGMDMAGKTVLISRFDRRRRPLRRDAACDIRRKVLIHGRDRRGPRCYRESSGPVADFLSGRIPSSLAAAACRRGARRSRRIDVFIQSGIGSQNGEANGKPTRTDSNCGLR